MPSSGLCALFEASFELTCVVWLVFSCALCASESVAPPFGTVNDQFSILLHEEEGADGAKESTIFEMTFHNWTWRKVKKRKKAKKVAAATAAAVSSPSLAAATAPPTSSFSAFAPPPPPPAVATTELAVAPPPPVVSEADMMD